VCVSVGLIIAPFKTPSGVRPAMVSEDEGHAPTSEEGAGPVGGLVEDLFAAEPTPAPASMKRYKPRGLFLGQRRDTHEAIDIPPQVLARHGAMLGSTGSGKTVMAKALIEEAALAGIPALIIDPQGDLARLALGIDPVELEEKDGDVARAKKLMEQCEVRIWTPLRSKGLPLCIDPFRAPPADLDQEEAITAWDMVAAGFANLAGFDVEKAQGKTVKPFLYEILVEGTRCGLNVGDFQALARVVREPHQEFIRHLYPECFDEDVEEEEKVSPPTWNEVMVEHRLTDFEERLPKSTRNDLARRLAAFSSGVNQLLFSNGVPIDIDAFVEPAVPGKIPLNIVYLNTIQDENQKQYFVQELSRELYDWMLTQQPADGELKLLFFMDEVAPYLPPHPRNPPAKDLIKLIFKQARKYGVACVLATQNVSDVDYKILAQANTTFIGRFTQPQDVEKVRHLLKESGGDQDLVAQLPTLGPGQFQMVAPDVDPNPVPIQCRWLYTDHGAPLNEDQVEELITPEIRAWAKTRSAGGGRSRGAGAAHAASRGSSWSGGSDWEDGAAQSIVETARIKSAGGMAAAAHGIVDDSAFEVKLMGGFAVLRDGRDPLYTMQAAVNLATVLVLGWVMAALMLAWRDADLSGWWLLVSATACFAAVGVLVLESVLGHDAELLQKLSRFAHTFQVLLVIWLWILLGWTVWGSLDLRGAEPMLEVVVVWVTLFTGIEYLTRFRLGRIRWNGGSALDKIVGVTALLTNAELTEMKATSKDLLSAVRWIVHGATLVWLCCLLALQSGVLPTGEEAVSWGRPTLWLASIYGLLFCSEAWLRLRGRWPNEHNTSNH